MPTSTLARVVHRTVLRPAGIRAAATVTVIPLQHMRSSPQFIQQRFAATSGDTSKRGSGSSSGRGSRSSGSGGGTEKTEPEILAADIDAELDYPIAAMDEQYSTTSWSDTPAGKSAAAKMASAATSAGASEQQQSTTSGKTTTASGTKHETLVGKADNTLFYLAMGFLGLTGAYLVLKPNPHPSASTGSSGVVEPRVDAKSSSSQPPSTQMQQGGSPPASVRRT
ncbi:hypothetical protein NEUTE1DRAFT_103264 [Neurospora tetrasperma FGSC 2508]|uniref:Uncharacterized protein n=1 Tax=Neurospora tetrasperma (strain FGSC 2508 / ATCC MYA-4615 / P0657) TaxID=510951 RepID=F8MS66_NEUT8|nr:uncharacterized protein NEUTE1DRAFT_103264 [Neurospora tetrasperma FGSC 2508]EGO55860.1 hypothetical protein NEUTE1DRAFT_103264 [Neurospora tetrasperma FGSC 2508]EGZ68883.1 hypothetical protein NEUTE2DRAFT_168559 [Neurospora tetrasperma FGSC 2509]